MLRSLFVLAAVVEATLDFSDSAIYLSPNEYRVATQLQVEFIPTRKMVEHDAVTVHLPKFTTGDCSQKPGHDIAMGQVWLSPGTVFTGAWHEDKGPFNWEYPYHNATLALKVKPGVNLTAGVRMYIKLYPVNGFKLYCGLKPNEESYTLRTNATWATKALHVFNSTPKVGLGCDGQASCSNAGTCDFCREKCTCFQGWGHPSDARGPDHNAVDCTERTCPTGIAWGDLPAKRAGLDGVFAHRTAECSGNGICEPTAGACICFPGFEGMACERRICPTGCSGHGRCMTMHALAQEASAMPLSGNPVRYGSGAPYEQGVEAFATTWDAEVMQGCLCDSSWPVGIGPGERQQPEWFGPDCSLRRCPTGDDPFTHGVDETDCSNQTLPSGVVTKNGNKCHVDCSNRGVCDYVLGECICQEGYYGNNCGQLAYKAHGDASRYYTSDKV